MQSPLAFLAKLRGGSAPLEIEIGRYVGTLPDLRVCKLCNTGVEDEMHFTLHCAALRQERMPLIDHMNTFSLSFEDLGMEYCIRCVMMEANLSRKIAKYLYNYTECT